MTRPPPRSPLFPNTPFSRSRFFYRLLKASLAREPFLIDWRHRLRRHLRSRPPRRHPTAASRSANPAASRDTSPSCRSEEHTSELQSRLHLVCRLLLEKKKTT